MDKEHQPLSFNMDIVLPEWSGTRRVSQMRSVLHILFRVSCWSAVAWLVWNHALSGFLNFGGIGAWESFGLGVFLSAVSKVLEDTPSLVV
jgi:hypothetical protein